MRHAWLLGAALALFLAPPARAQEAETVVGVRFEGAVAEAERLAELSAVRTGAPYDPVKVRETLELFYQKGLFSAIAVDRRPAPGGVVVAFHFTAQPLITAWRFVGNRHLDDAALSRAMDLEWGMPLLPSRLEGYAAAIARRYEREGFPRAKATFEAIRHNSRETTLVVRVEEGAPIALADIEVNAAGPLSALDVRRELGLKRDEPLRREALFEGIERIESALTGEAYLNGRVGHYFRLVDGRRVSTYAGLVAEQIGPAKPGATAPVTLVVAVEAGQKGIVAVDADVQLPTGTLAQAITVYENRSYSPFELDHSAERLRAAYVQAGYARATVKHALVKQPDDSYRITFHVEAGPKLTIRAIDFQGNAAFDDETLRRVISTRAAGMLGGGAFDAGRWEADMRSLTAYYQSNGFLQMKVAGFERLAGPGEHELTLVVRVSEGPRSLIRRLLFEGAGGLHQAGLLQTVSVNPGDPYDPSEIPEYLASVQAYYARTGYPLAKSDARYDAETGTLTLKVSPGPRKRLGAIVLRGNVKTEDPVVRRQFTVQPGRLYNSEELLATQQRIYQLGFFDRVSVEPLRPISDDPKEPIDLVVVMHERETGWVALGGGFGDLEGPQASLEYQQLNLLGTGRPLRLEGVFSQRNSRATFALRDPYLFGRELIGESGFSFVRERRQLGGPLVQSYGPTVSLSRQLTERLLGTVRYAWNDVRYPEGGGLNRIDSLVTTGLTFDSRSDLLSPRWGTKTEFNVDVASPLLGGTLLYTRPRLALSHFVPFPRRIVLALGAEVGYVQPLFDTQGIPSDLLFLTGGANSLRGYGYNTVGVDTGASAVTGGRGLLLTHVEARVPVWGDLGVVGFADAGNVWATASQVGFADLRLTAGPGLRYETPVGPLRVDYGFQVWPRPGFGAFHFGIGQAF